MPQRGIITVDMLSADLQELRQLRCSAEDGESRTLTGIVQRHPCHATNGIRQPRAQLYHRAISAPGHTHRTDILHHRVAHGIVHIDLVGTHPRIGERRDDTVGLTLYDRAILLFLVRIWNQMTAAQVLRRTLIITAEQTHHILHTHLLIRLHTERQVLYRITEMLRGC